MKLDLINYRKQFYYTMTVPLSRQMKLTSLIRLMHRDQRPCWTYIVSRADKCIDVCCVFNAWNSALDTCHTALSSHPILTQGVKWEGQSRLLLSIMSIMSLCANPVKMHWDIWSGWMGAWGQDMRTCIDANTKIVL